MPLTLQGVLKRIRLSTILVNAKRRVSGLECEIIGSSLSGANEARGLRVAWQGTSAKTVFDYEMELFVTF